MPVTKYVWDGENCLAETDGAGVVQALYTYEPQTYGNLISERRGSTSLYYHHDALGSTRQLAISLGATFDKWTYFVWGKHE